MVQQPDDYFKAPDVIGESGGDPRRHAQRSMVVVYCELIGRAGPPSFAGNHIDFR